MTVSDNVPEGFPSRLADGLWVLGNYYFNLYLVKGEQSSALIEAGVSAVVDDVIRQLELLKVTPSFLVVTHPHADHVTGLAGFRDRYPQALTVAGEGASEFLAHPRAAAALVAEDRHMSEFLASKGLPPGRPPVLEPPSLENCLVAKDGDEMDLGGVTLKFLVVAGHSPGKIVVYIPELGALIPSDSLGFRYPGAGLFPLFLTNYSEYMATLDRLERLNPEIVGPAHQGVILGPQIPKIFEEARSLAKQLREKILEDSRPEEELIQDLFDKYYQDELTMYTRENIMNCARLVMKRAMESRDTESL